MVVPGPSCSYVRACESALESLRRASSRILMADYDGTLAPFRRHRQKAYPYAGVRETLDRIARGKHTRLVIISGRAISDLVNLLGLKSTPEIWGSHGWERLWPDGRYKIWPAGENALKGLAEADREIETKVSPDRIEAKPHSLALHWRGLSKEEIDSLKKAVLKDWRRIAVRYSLEIKNFDGGAELRAPGRNKGDAVNTVISEGPKGSFAAYLGDDLTDEDAFHAIEGQGLGVLVRKKPRPTKAGLHLRPPEELLEFLNMWDVMAKKDGGRMQ